MQCPFCKHEETRVVDSRVARDAQAVRRRRACDACGRRFTTYERVEILLPVVVKRDGRREAFDREKVRGGVEMACRKRAISSNQIEALVGSIERIYAEAGDREVASTDIGEAVMRSLRDLDEVAYVRFASVYRDFRDVKEFMSELTQILSQKGGDGS